MCSAGRGDEPESAGEKTRLPKQGGTSASVTNNTKFTFQTAWTWEFMPLKPEVVPCSPALLMAIKLAHYFTFIAQGGVTWMFYMAKPWLTSGIAEQGGPTLFGWIGWIAERLGVALPTCLKSLAELPTPLSDLGVFLLIMGSMYQAMAGAFFIMAHEYDGWQIATYVWPEKGEKGQLDPTQKNDDRLRLVSYQFLWMFQALGMGMSAFAITQAAISAALAMLKQHVTPSLSTALPLLSWQAWPAVLAAVLIVACFIISKWVPSVYFNSPLGPHPVMVTPVNTMAFFIAAATAYGVNLGCLLGSHWLWGLAAVLCFAGGGLLEAFGAEGSLEQGYHVAAVAVISTGAVLLMTGLQAAAVLKVGPDLLPWGLTLPWLVPTVQMWLGLLALAGVAMIMAARYVETAAPTAGIVAAG